MHAKTPSKQKTGWLALLGPGLLVAATGVGAGDLATGALAGSEVGVAVLWAVLAGAALKFIVNEGLARWQLATGTTLLEGSVERLGAVVAVLFLPYLILWSFFVASALMSACGATFHAMVPIFDSPEQAKRLFGMAHSAAGVGLVLWGGFRLFEVVMKCCIAVMFLTVVVTAGLLMPSASEVGRGLLWPDLRTLQGANLEWTVALMGGIGGTVTVLCYGYWIRESGRMGEADLRASRIDLAAAYLMTALFGIAMVIIGSTVEVKGSGAGLIVELARRLEEPFGPIGKWAFLFGAWGAVFSSLLGVWQAVPYLFADLWRLLRLPKGGPAPPVDTQSWPYRAYLWCLATIPMLGLFHEFKTVQKIYAIVGAMFIPLLAVVLLLLNGRTAWVGERCRNGWPTVLALVIAIAFFAWFGWMEATEWL